MNDREMLERMVRIATRWRNTPIVDDDFVEMKHQFDNELTDAAAHLKAKRPTIVCLCGSTRFSEAYRRANLDETMAGRIVLSIGATKDDLEAISPSPQNADRADIKADLDALHLKKIEMADEVLILNAKTLTCLSCNKPCVQGEVWGSPTGRSQCCQGELKMLPYIGESTRKELKHAMKLDKKVRFLEA